MQFEVSSYAKINSFLNVLGKRADGYHEIYTHFQLLELNDTLFFSKSSQNQVFCDDITPEENIILKSVEWFNNKFDKNQHFSVTVEKNIPMGAGLGGAAQMQQPLYVSYAIIMALKEDYWIFMKYLMN